MRSAMAVQVLHQSRLKAGPANEPTAAAFLDKLRRQKQLYSAPFGSNDDWYWLYAAVQAGMCSVPTPETQANCVSMICSDLTLLCNG